MSDLPRFRLCSILDSATVPTLISNMQKVETMYQSYTRALSTPHSQPTHKGTLTAFEIRLLKSAQPTPALSPHTQPSNDPFKRSTTTTTISPIRLQAILTALHTALHRLTSFRETFLARVQALDSQSPDLAANLAPICADARENLFALVLDLEADVARRYEEAGQGWKMEGVKKDVEELVRRRPAMGVMVVERLGWRIGVV
ncbi:hypothetical protein BKA63DRAFT_492083 [Paraphoma chrysanthemicola]|nr:hypothetical protein BKA63DRAFT_492083 [Paraphoma chrysanthemicola]